MSDVMADKLYFEDLNSLEKIAALELIAEAKRLWKHGNLTRGISFEEWLQQLTESLALAVTDYDKENAQ
jgi:hypothetical protein